MSNEIVMFLDENDNKTSSIVIDKLVESFNLNLKEGIKIYNTWREKYIKEHYKSTKKPLNLNKVGVNFSSLEQYAKIAGLRSRMNTENEILKILKLKQLGVNNMKSLNESTGISIKDIRRILFTAANNGILKNLRYL